MMYLVKIEAKSWGFQSWHEHLSDAAWHMNLWLGRMPHDTPREASITSQERKELRNE